MASPDVILVAALTIFLFLALCAALVLVVISLNGGWTADPKREKVGRDLGYTQYHKMAESLGCYGEYVEKPEEIGAALVRAELAGGR